METGDWKRGSANGATRESQRRRNRRWTAWLARGRPSWNAVSGWENSVSRSLRGEWGGNVTAGCGAVPGGNLSDGLGAENAEISRGVPLIFRCNRVARCSSREWWGRGSSSSIFAWRRIMSTGYLTVLTRTISKKKVGKGFIKSSHYS